MADRYLALENGRLKEVEGQITGGTVTEGGKIVALDTSTGRLHLSVMPDGILPDRALIQASENIAAGDMVNIHDVAGNARVRKADASNGFVAVGFCPDSITSGQSGFVYFEGTLSGLTDDASAALAIGSTYYLSGTVAGRVTSTPPSTSGYIVQTVGVSYSTDELSFEPGEEIELA